MFLKKVSQKYKILAEDKNPIERSLTLSLTLREAAIALGHKDWLSVNDYLDGDSHDDVYHGGISDVQDVSVPGMADVEKIFPSEVASALEDAEREAYASALGSARRDALVEGFEKIHVTGEYQSSDGDMISAGGAGVESATLGDEKIELVIKNPEHLINDIVNGVGRWAPPFDPYEKASDEEIKKQLINHADDYFDVYGRRKPDVPDRISPDNVDEEHFASTVAELCENLSLEEIVDNVLDALDSGRLDSQKEVIDLAAKYSGSPRDQIKKSVLDHLHDKSKKFSGASAKGLKV